MKQPPDIGNGKKHCRFLYNFAGFLAGSFNQKGETTKKCGHVALGIPRLVDGPGWAVCVIQKHCDKINCLIIVKQTVVLPTHLYKLGNG